MANATLRGQTKKVNYKPTVNGGATGYIGLGEFLPSGSIVTRIMNVSGTTLTGATGAKLAVYVGTTLGITAHACGGATFTGLDVLNSTPFKLSADSEVQVRASSTIRAGEIDLYVEYLLP